MTTQDQHPGMPTAVKVLLIVGLIFVLLVLGAAGTCAFVIMRNPKLRTMGSLMGETMRMSMAATKAPGTQQLRDAGCSEAMVMDMRRLARLIDDLAEEGDADVPSEKLDSVMVMCQVDSDAEALSCEEVARVYGSAVDNPPEEFVTAVQVRFRRQPLCQGIHAPDGTRLKDFESKQFQFGTPPSGRPYGELPPGEAEPLFPEAPAEEPQSLER